VTGFFRIATSKIAKSSRSLFTGLHFVAADVASPSHLHSRVRSGGREKIGLAPENAQCLERVVGPLVRLDCRPSAAGYRSSERADTRQ
jgi:hypothetical protein